MSLEHPELFYAAHIPLCTFFSSFNFAVPGLSFSVWVPGHTRSQNQCSHTKCHTPMHTCICEHISHTHRYPHTSLCLSLPLFLSPTSNNSSAYKTKWHLWIIAQCPLWMALQVLTMHIHICYKKSKTIASITWKFLFL